MGKKHFASPSLKTGQDFLSPFLLKRGKLLCPLLSLPDPPVVEVKFQSPPPSHFVAPTIPVIDDTSKNLSIQMVFLYQPDFIVHDNIDM